MFSRISRSFFIFAIGICVSLVAVELPVPTAEKLPRYRGFNLLEKFYKGSNSGPYKESDFQMISELGFNFVRLPMDYRLWIKDGDWTQFDQQQFKEIDHAIEWGKKYQIHVCLNFHRAPGYTVAQPPEPTSLWTDAETQKICAMHWAYFAKRYKGIPNRFLSFNLLNEPANIDKETFLAVNTLLVNAIHKEDPDRLIIADGMNWSVDPCADLKPLGIAQATRGYQPFGLTHYKAEWASGAMNLEVPTWPQPIAVGGFLYGPEKKDLQSPILIDVNLDQSCKVKLKIGQVSSSGHLVALANGKKLWQQEFKPGPGEGPWEKVIYQEQWNTYQNEYNRFYEFEAPAGKYTLKVDNTKGDWLTILAIAFEHRDGRQNQIGVTPEWGQENVKLTYDQSNKVTPFTSEKQRDRKWLWDKYVEPWVKLKEENVGVMVGEWGTYNKTPHDVTLRWMEDCLINFKQADLGWALWNFRGSFGIMDSNRADVRYESYKGHKLDRKMLELLQKY